MSPASVNSSRLSRAAPAHRGSGCTMQEPGRAATDSACSARARDGAAATGAAASIASSSATPSWALVKYQNQPSAAANRNPRSAPGWVRPQASAARRLSRSARSRASAPSWPAPRSRRSASRGQAGHVGGVRGLDPFPLTGLIEAFGGVLAQRLQHAEAGPVPRDHQRAVDQAGMQVEYVEIVAERSSLPGSSLPGSAQTCSAASRLHPPRNTASRRNSTRSGSVSSWWLQSMAARRVRCRGSAVRGPEVSSRNRSSSRAAISAPAAASPAPRPAPAPAAARRAGGRSAPPRARCRASRTKPGSASRARSTNSRTASDPASSTGAASARRDGQRRERELRLPGDAQRFPAGGQQPHAGARRRAAGRRGRRRRRRGARSCPARPARRGGASRRSTRSSAVPGPVGAPTASATAGASAAGSATPASATNQTPSGRRSARPARGDLDGEAGLAHSAGPGERHQAPRPQQLGERRAFAVPPDERGQPRRRASAGPPRAPACASTPAVPLSAAPRCVRSWAGTGWMERVGAARVGSWRSIACSSARSCGRGIQAELRRRGSAGPAGRRRARRPGGRPGTARASAGRAAAPAADAAPPGRSARRPARRAARPPGGHRATPRSRRAAARSSRCRWSRAHGSVVELGQRRALPQPPAPAAYAARGPVPRRGAASSTSRVKRCTSTRVRVDLEQVAGAAGDHQRVRAGRPPATRCAAGTPAPAAR